MYRELNLWRKKADAIRARQNPKMRQRSGPGGWSATNVQPIFWRATNDDHAENTTGLMAEKVRQPIKKFIGRRTAAERAEKNEKPNGEIEDGGALQGSRVQYD